MESYKLVYYNVHARVQHVRYLFAVGKVPYDDHRVLMKDWPKMKPSCELGTIPLLEINGKQRISQSLAIGRYVAKVTKLYGSNIYEEGLVDMITDTANECLENFIPVYRDHIEGEELEARIKKLRTACANLSKILGENKYFVENKLSWADIHFYHCFEVLTKQIGKFAVPEIIDVLKDSPNLDKLFNRIDEHPEIVSSKKNNEKTYIGLMVPRPEKPFNPQKVFQDVVKLEESLGL